MDECRAKNHELENLNYIPVHNWVLEVDGLDKKWRNGVISDWEGAIGEISVGNATSATTSEANNNTSVTTTRDDGGVDNTSASLLPSAIYY
jgi:hypothetical protein